MFLNEILALEFLYENDESTFTYLVNPNSLKKSLDRVRVQGY